MKGHPNKPKILTKKCTKCKRELPLNNFTRTNSRGFKDGHAFWCKDCMNLYRKEYYKKEEVRVRLLQSVRKWGNKIRRTAMEKLCGGEPSCAICGFKGDIRLLQLDHINNDGNEERNMYNTKSCYHGYKDILNIPVEEARKKYQVLCIPHNWIRRYGVDGKEYALVKIVE